MARIALIKCDQPSRGTEGRTPPLGLMMIAAILREKGNHSIRILDARFHGKSLPKLLKEINPAIVGLSALTIEAHSLHRIADTAKGLFPRATVIAGGPHASFYPEEVLSNPNIDIVVRGEGENTFSELVDKEYKNISQKRVPKNELKKAKDYTKGKMTLILETSDAQASFYGFQEILKKEILTPEEIYKRIDKITANDILKIARDIFQPQKLNLALIGPFKEKEKFQKLLRI